MWSRIMIVYRRQLQPSITLIPNQPNNFALKKQMPCWLCFHPTKTTKVINNYDLTSFQVDLRSNQISQHPPRLGLLLASPVKVELPNFHSQLSFDHSPQDSNLSSLLQLKENNLWNLLFRSSLPTIYLS